MESCVSIPEPAVPAPRARWVVSLYRCRSLAQVPPTGMSLYFEELDYRPTPIGALSLRRRREFSLGVDVFEIKLGDEYLMSSLFTASEIALARLGLEHFSIRLGVARVREISFAFV
jgi:hypothetical protein